MGISLKVAVIEFLAILLLCAVGYAYYHFTEQEIVTLKVNAAQLQTAVDTEKQTIAAQAAATAQQDAAMSALQQKSDAAENARRTAEDKLRKHNLDALARNNAATLETHINQATSKAFLDIEHVTDPNAIDVATPTTTKTTQVKK